jgi:hypothetical protein
VSEVAAGHSEYGARNCPPSGGALGADPRLVAEGWEARFLADPARCEEAVTLYRELGFEVRAEPVPAEQLGPYCVGCQVAVCRGYNLIYTRWRP